MIELAALLAVGVFSLIAGIIVAGVRLVLWRKRAYATLPEPDRYLQRAGSAAGCAALVPLLARFVWPVLPGTSAVPMIIYAGLLILCATQFIIGAVGCWGLRKRQLAVSAAFKLVFGLGLALYLWLRFPLARLSLPHTLGSTFGWLMASWPLWLAHAAFLIGVWCAATGAARLMLLTVGGSGAIGRILRHIDTRVGRLRSARDRSY